MFVFYKQSNSHAADIWNSLPQWKGHWLAKSVTWYWKWSQSNQNWLVVHLIIRGILTAKAVWRGSWYKVSERQLTFELSSFVLEIPNNADAALTQNLFDCSTLSQEYCKLIGWYHKKVNATLNIIMPYWIAKYLSCLKCRHSWRWLCLSPLILFLLCWPIY